MSRNSLRKYLSFFIFYFLFSPVAAQTFTQRLQQQKSGQGTVTISQDPQIDQLVNSENLTPGKSATTSTTGSTKPNSATDTATKTATSTAKPGTPANTTQPESSTEVDTSKKVMRGTKVNGYRVQAFAGGNSRKDRQQAEQIGNNIKAQFGNVPVYVHFYSPRWICRVGNYRTYEEAHQMLVSLKNMGYTQASIVKGKITVQY